MQAAICELQGEHTQVARGECPTNGVRCPQRQQSRHQGREFGRALSIQSEPATSNKRTFLARFALLKSADDVFVHRAREFLEFEEHEHWGADSLNFFHQRSLYIFDHDHGFCL